MFTDENGRRHISPALPPILAMVAIVSVALGIRVLIGV